MARITRLSGQFLLAAMCASLATLPLSFGQAIATPASPDAGVSFAAYDVVSVKPANPDGPHSFGVRPLPNGIDGPSVTVAQLIYQAYIAPMSLPPKMVVTGLPAWANSDLFSVQAKMSTEQAIAFSKLNGDEQKMRQRAMLQAVLADRFNIKLHMENRPLDVYELVVAKGGVKMKESDTSPDGQINSDGTPVPFSMHGLSNGDVNLTVQGKTMQQFANWIIAAGLDRAVVDKTGLTGKYSFTLTFASAGPTGDGASDPSPLIFQALEAKLGLRLQRATDPIGVVVVDHVEQPAAN